MSERRRWPTHGTSTVALISISEPDNSRSDLSLASSFILSRLRGAPRAAAAAAKHRVGKPRFVRGERKKEQESLQVIGCKSCNVSGQIDKRQVD